MGDVDVHRPVLRLLLHPQNVHAVLVRQPLLELRAEDAVLQRDAALLAAVAVLLQSG